MGAAGKAVAAFGDKADDIADVAKRIGLSAEALQELQYAARPRPTSRRRTSRPSSRK